MPHSTPRQILTLCLLVLSAIGARAQVEFERGLEQVTFVPKGQWITGVNVSYTQSDFDNYRFLILENLSGDTYSFKVSPMLFYAFQDNLAAGARTAYTRSRTRLNSADITMDGEPLLSTSDAFLISQDYYGTAALRNYVSLGRSMRFAFFNEFQLQLGGGQSKIVSGSGNDITGTYSDNFSLNVGLAPGMLMFLNNYSALEVNVGVLGFSYRNRRLATDQIYLANTKTKSANFQVNLFSIAFGVAFYL